MGFPPTRPTLTFGCDGISTQWRLVSFNSIKAGRNKDYVWRELIGYWHHHSPGEGHKAALRLLVEGNSQTPKSPHQTQKENSAQTVFSIHYFAIPSSLANQTVRKAAWELRGYRSWREEHTVSFFSACLLLLQKSWPTIHSLFICEQGQYVNDVPIIAGSAWNFWPWAMLYDSSPLALKACWNHNLPGPQEQPSSPEAGLKNNSGHSKMLCSQN